MSIPLADVVNGLFEFGGGAFNILNVLKLRKDKQVRGVSLLPTVIFSAWGLWNLYYYPHLDQWVSFSGGLIIVGANITWCTLAWKYRNA